MKWQPANNGAGKHIYFLYAEDESGLAGDRHYHEDGRGRLIRYRSYKTAKRAADRLNAQTETT